MLSQEKVSSFKDCTVYEDIMAFLEEFDQKTKDKRQNRKKDTSETRRSYERNIREFFKITRDKEVEHLTEEDLQFKKREIINYRKILQENDNSNSTVNQKLASVKSLFQFLNAEHNINTAVFDLKRLDVETQHYGKMTKDEAELFAETAYQTERAKGLCKKLLILTAIRTSFRLDELLNLRWSNFEKDSEISYKVSVTGKRGKNVSNGISVKLYEQLLELKDVNKEEFWNGDPEIVFQIDARSVTRMMDRLRQKLEIDPSRNIVFHSFRNVGINWEYETTLDIKKAAQQANHSNIDTTYKSYIDHNRDYSQAAGVRMDEEIDLSFLDNLTVDDFKEFIKQSGFKTQIEIMNYFNKN
ncbi:site-specific integrase [Neobacillus vireti]|uniref:tyrosine-type recombinase/integrase n=1 Tax=Neobacillus vireti TaxID=220686 RepID=UPI002FFD805D